MSGPKVIFSNMTGIDNGLGLGIGATNEGKETYTMLFRNSKIYGESPAPDCPQNGRGGYCDKSSRCGLMSAISLEPKPKPIHPLAPTFKPYHKSMNYASWSAVALFKNMEFINFYERTSTGAR